MKSKKGITLIELVIVMALLGIVLTSAYSMLMFSNRVHVKAVDEFDLQSSFRLVTEHTNRIARFLQPCLRYHGPVFVKTTYRMAGITLG